MERAVAIPRQAVPLMLIAAALLGADRSAAGQAPRRETWVVFRQSTATAEWRQSPLPANDENRARSYVNVLCSGTRPDRDHAVKIVSPTGVETVIVCSALSPGEAAPAPAAPRYWTIYKRQADGGAWVLWPQAGNATTELHARASAGQACIERPHNPSAFAVRLVSPDGAELVLLCSEQRRGTRRRAP